MHYSIKSFVFLVRSNNIVMSSNKQQLVRALSAPTDADYPDITDS